MNNKKVFLILNHLPTKTQKKDLFDWGISEVIEMPEKIKQIWQNIPSDKESVSKTLRPMKSWIKKNAAAKDLIWIQGEHGATFNLVSFCFKNNFSPIYSTSIRCLKEEKGINGRVKTIRFFTHARFRNYEE